jgi:3-oxoacyl-[acyl-carrier-protein] synthase II
MSHQRDREHRVVVTGIGVVSPIGIGVDAFWDSLLNLRQGIGPVEMLSASPLPHHVAGEVKGFEAGKHTKTKDQKKSLKVMCRDIQLGVVSAWQALDHAGVVPGAVEPERLGVEFGANLMLCPPPELARACYACLDDQGRFVFEQWGTKGLGDMEPLWLLKFLPNMPACHIGIAADARGPNNSITLDDASGGLVLGEALRVIARGHADIIITGATGTRLHSVKSMHQAMWNKLADAPEGQVPACRPFDLRRNGQIVGEAAATLILEEEEHARKRGAKTYGRILGAGAACVAPKTGNRGDVRKALALAMKNALADARVTPADVGHICAHASGDPDEDRQEALAIHDVFGDLGSKVPVTALKSYFGNSGSGSGVLELAGSLVALSRGFIPATLNYEQPDPACPLNVVAGAHLATSNKIVLKANVTMMGQASAVVACGV